MGRLMKIAGRKGAQDAKRGQFFTKLVREINVAARQGGSDVKSNPRLRLAVDKAVAAKMAKDAIERAIKKATGELEGVDYEELRYEGYAPGGIAVIVDCLTENKVRSVGEVRHAFSKHGGNLGTDGSVAFMFKKCGVISFPEGSNEDVITEAAIDAGAEDVVLYPEDGAIDVITSVENFEEVKNAIIKAGLQPEESGVTMRAENDVKISGETAEQVIKMLEMLEDLDDVQTVYSNAELEQ